VLSNHRTWPQRLLLTFNISLAVVCLVAAGGLGWAYSQASALPRIDVGASLSPPPPPGDPQNILLVGIDDGMTLGAGDPVLRGRSATLNTDTIMILRVDPKTQQAALLSLPRDLYVDLAGGGKGRINSALAIGGPERLIETIKQDFDIPINHYAMVNFQGFESLVSAIDGVPVYFPFGSRDQATGLFQYDPGCVTLSGDQALAYARSRQFEIYRPESKSWQKDPSSDFGRITRQQQFIKAALRKAVSKGIRNPFVLKDLLGVAQKNVTLDTQFSIQDLVDLGTQFRNFDPESLATYSPVVSGAMVGAMSVLILDAPASQPIFDVFRGTAPIPSPLSAGSTTPESTTSSTTSPSSTTTRANGGSPTSMVTTTTRPVTTTTLSDFIPRAPEGTTCG
jgi:LCP family protein required for cell wall assembly